MLGRVWYVDVGAVDEERRLIFTFRPDCYYLCVRRHVVRQDPHHSRLEDGPRHHSSRRGLFVPELRGE